jgi:hypothetical protein
MLTVRRASIAAAPAAWAAERAAVRVWRPASTLPESSCADDPFHDDWNHWAQQESAAASKVTVLDKRMIIY